MTLFAHLATLADTLAAEPSRLKKRAAIAAAIQETSASSVADAGLFALYLSGEPFAESDPRKLNAGGALLTRAIKAVSQCTDAALTAAYRRHGDLGAAAFDLLQQAPVATETLSLQQVAAAFAELAAARSTAVRAATVERLLRACSPLEAKYLLKLMLADMRIGVKQSLIEEAIAVASEQSLAEVRHAVMLEADLAATVERAFAGTLADAHMRLFHPLGFMLASPVETPEEAVARFTGKTVAAAGEDAEALPAPPVINAFLEDKYDGMRAQLHCGDPAQPSRVALFSRNREDITHSFPEIVEAFANLGPSPTGPLILDGEILGWDQELQQALPFAILGQRIGRKIVDNDLRQRVPVVFMAFDLLYAAEELLLPLPLRERRARLEAAVATLAPLALSPLRRDEHAHAAQSHLFASEVDAEPAVSRLLLSPAKLVESAEAIDTAYADARARANEGVMIKAADSAYQPGRRGLAWVKLKRELATLDVVITGAEFGHGRRAGLLSDYTFAVRSDPGDGGSTELLNVGKAYSGVTDAEIAELTAWMQAHTLEDHGHFRTVEPLRVIEVAFNNIMRSDRHASGFALRFPRILKLRDDKPLSEIDTLARVEEIYQQQPDKPQAATDGDANTTEL